ncbi:MAG: sugar phosphate isomerase/epimerase family protein [Kiritimatiellales bacterium]
MSGSEAVIKTGLCSVTFRQLTAVQIISLVKEAGLDAIEWGGDVHVPPGNRLIADEVRRRTLDEGLAVSSYGSYYRILDEQGRVQDFEPVLESALALGTNTIRIWAGCAGSDVMGDSDRSRLVEEGGRIAAEAAGQGVRIAFEFHRNTLTDTNESAERLLKEIGHANLYMYWQPIWWGPEVAYRLQGLEMLRKRILNLHVFYWLYDAVKEQREQRPLSDGRQDWSRYLAAELSSGDHFALLEFVRNNEPSQFLRDAATLRSWLGDKAGAVNRRGNL